MDGGVSHGAMWSDRRYIAHHGHGNARAVAVILRPADNDLSCENTGKAGK